MESGGSGETAFWMARVEESIEIHRTPDDVWAVISNPENDPKWCRKVRSVEPSGDARWRVIHRPVPLRPPLELAVEQLAWDPPHFMRLREEDDASVFDVEYQLEPTAGGTRFTQISEFEWKNLPRFLHRLFAQGIRRDVRGQLRDLREFLE
jgi:uncharacterized protein YndB with AHSA1/START domain